MTFFETLEQAKKDYGLGSGEYFKAKEGANRIRLVSQAVFYQSSYNGTVTNRFVCWILDRSDKIVKPYFMPISVMNAIVALQLDPDYAFDELPDYDITINAKGAGNKEVKYSVLPARTNTFLTPEEKASIAERMPIEEFVEKLKAKQGGQITETQQTQHENPVIEQELTTPEDDLVNTPF